jgi:hypothetical protein
MNPLATNDEYSVSPPSPVDALAFGVEVTAADPDLLE